MKYQSRQRAPPPGPAGPACAKVSGTARSAGSTTARPSASQRSRSASLSWSRKSVQPRRSHQPGAWASCTRRLDDIQDGQQRILRTREGARDRKCHHRPAERGGIEPTPAPSAETRAHGPNDRASAQSKGQATIARDTVDTDCGRARADGRGRDEREGSKRVCTEPRASDAPRAKHKPLRAGKAEARYRRGAPEPLRQPEREATQQQTEPERARPEQDRDRRLPGQRGEQAPRPNRAPCMRSRDTAGRARPSGISSLA